MRNSLLDDLSGDFGRLKQRILAETSDIGREWEKVAVLSDTPHYLEFVAGVSGCNVAGVRNVLDEFCADLTFRERFAPALEAFESDSTLLHGDLRFHSVTLYAVVRLTTPEGVVETGVASGKSSSMLLLALAHNERGRLVSIDLPNSPGSTLSDGAGTHTGGRPVGWLVPEYLRDRWELRLGDARSVLEQAAESLGAVDLFLHDSLHTPDHVAFELRTIAPRLRAPATLLVDDADLSLSAFTSFLGDAGLRGLRFGNMAGVRVAGAVG